MIAPFVGIEWLQQHRRDVVLADVRFYLDGRSGGAAYESGHLPGAVYVELADVLADPDAPTSRGRHPLPSYERFAAGLGAAGIGDRDTVVAYDDAGGVIAARLVWLLRAIGHPAALLDGGLSAWPGPLETGAGEPRVPAAFTPRPWPADRIVSIDEVASTDAVVIDARDADRYAGAGPDPDPDPDPVDPRSGHIPGARSLPARENVRPGGRLIPSDELRARLAAVGIGAETQVISSCGSGVTACHNLLVLEHVGLGPGRLYPGSWSEWSRDPSRPIESGS